MNEQWIVLPVLIPFFTAVAVLLLRDWLPGIKRIVSIIGSGLAFINAVFLLRQVSDGDILVSQMGGWPAPYGITFVVDPFSAVMLFLATLTAVVVHIYALDTVSRSREYKGFYVLYHFLVMGVSGSFITGDLFNLFVFFEIMLISSFGLMTLGGSHEQLAGGLKYVIINMVSSTLFLIALGVVYGTTGTLNMADLARQLTDTSDGLTAVLAVLFLITFGIKAGIFPLFFWLPESYHTPPPVVTAFFAGLLTKVGVYALIRVFTLIFLKDAAFIHPLLLIIASFTMLIGVLGAAAQNNIRRILSFHIISQIGYMIMGLGFYTPIALAGTILFLAHNMLAKTALFLMGGYIEKWQGTEDLKKLGGIFRISPALAILFLLPALTLAGLPPLLGFFSKFILLYAGVESSQYIMVIFSLIVSIMTLFSMMKIWNEAFWKPAPRPLTPPPYRQTWRLLLPLTILGGLCLLFGLGIEQAYTVAMTAANTLLNPEIYITAVLGS